MLPQVPSVIVVIIADAALVAAFAVLVGFKRSQFVPSVTLLGSKRALRNMLPGYNKFQICGTYPSAALPPFYWVPTVDTVMQFEVSGAYGEVVAKAGDYEDRNGTLPIAGTLRMTKGGLYAWTIQIVRQCPHRPQLHFGLQGVNHARPWRLVSTGRCGRCSDDGLWLPRPSGDFAIGEGDYVHCEVDLRGLHGQLGAFAFAVNDGPFETVFEDIPLSGPMLQPVIAMGGNGTACRIVAE